MNRTPFLQPYSLALRIWHWLSFLVTTFLILTVLVAEFVLGEDALSSEEASKAITAVDHKQAETITNALRENVWEWHTIMGYVLIGLFVFRIVLEFFQPKDQRFVFKFRSAAKNKMQPKRKQYLFAKLTYIFFYLLLIGISSTGVWLAFHEEQKNIPDYAEMKELHENCYNMILVFLFLHLGGVLLAELKHSKGVVSNMINGGKHIDIS